MAIVSAINRVGEESDGPTGVNQAPTPVFTAPTGRRDIAFPEFDVPLLTTDLETIAGLAHVFEVHGLNQEGLNKALGEAGQRLSLCDVPLFERRLAAETPLNILLRLFTLHLSVNEAAARAAFAPVPLERLRLLGILEQDAKGVRVRVGLSFCDDLWLFHDRMADSPDLLRPDHVLGINPAALTLANLTVRTSVDCALDVGTGCGVQALLAARHCRNVIATDTNPRALNYTRFNALLNRRTNVECRLGSLFEPVAGAKFDLIVCNPPFVISPESQYLFRDSGLPADQLSEQVVRAAPGLLKEGGFASILCSWAHWKEEDWSERPREWAAHSGCDAYVLRGTTEDPLGHAALWNEGFDRDAFGKQLDLWQDYYRKVGIKALTVGAVVLRRRSAGPNWTRTDEVPKKFHGTCSAHLLRATEAEDLLAALRNDDELFERVFTLPPDHRLHQVLLHTPGKFEIQRMEIELQGGLQFVGKLDSASYQLLRQCDGQRTLGRIIMELAAMGKTSVERIRAQASGVAREMIRSGFLVPIPGTKAVESGSPGGGFGGAATSQIALDIPPATNKGS